MESFDVYEGEFELDHLFLDLEGVVVGHFAHCFPGGIFPVFLLQLLDSSEAEERDQDGICQEERNGICERRARQQAHNGLMIGVHCTVKGAAISVRKKKRVPGLIYVCKKAKCGVPQIIRPSVRSMLWIAFDIL